MTIIVCPARIQYCSAKLAECDPAAMQMVPVKYGGWGVDFIPTVDRMSRNRVIVR